MGKSQRTKGAVYEREVSKAINRALGTAVQRHLGQARDGGDDMFLAPFRIECKRRQSLAVYPFLDQCAKSCQTLDEIPVVIARADNKDSIAIMDLTTFLHLWNYARRFGFPEYPKDASPAENVPSQALHPCDQPAFTAFPTVDDCCTHCGFVYLDHDNG